MCSHDAHEECMFCARCGFCREDLDEEDICPDCQETTSAARSGK